MQEMKYVEGLNKEMFERKANFKYKFKAEPGLTKEVVISISKEKNEPDWMLQKRLKAFEVFQKLEMPNWGPSLKELDLNKIVYYALPDAKKNAKSWDEVPAEIKKTFERLGIPEAEQKYLAGAGAQMESQTIYHKLREDLEKQGVIFLDFDEAVKKHPEMVKEYFMTKCVPVTLHKFAALHGAVFSSGTFIYVPENVKIDMPLQAYFRMNAEKGGQFEHTLIIVDKNAEVSYIEGCSSPRYTSEALHAGCVEIFVKENAVAKYHSVENWSKNTYNLNTKRAIVEKNGVIEWINGNCGSKVTMLYPTSVLIGENAKSDFLGIAFAGEKQDQDTGSKVYHLAPNTKSTIKSKSISKDGGITTYRGLVNIKKGAVNSKSFVQCDALILDEKSISNTVPYMEIKESKVDVGHEATVGKISQDKLFYLMSRGLSEEQALKMIVAGFIEPIVKALPMEYAVELNRLIEMEMENAVG